jgi:hypothetical protein
MIPPDCPVFSPCRTAQIRAEFRAFSHLGACCLRRLRLAPGALQGDDYQFEYYENGYPKVPRVSGSEAQARTARGGGMIAEKPERPDFRPALSTLVDALKPGLVDYFGFCV